MYKKRTPCFSRMENANAKFSSCFLAGLSRRKGKAAVMDDKISFTQHGISR
jgi:hypothetical protein